MSANFPSECVTDESDSSVIFSLMNRVRAFLNALSSLINASAFSAYIDFKITASRNPTCILIFAKNHVTHLSKSADSTL